MKNVELILQEHEYKQGRECPSIEPNILENSIFLENGEVIGFYIKDMSQYSELAVKVANFANGEFRSDRVPKSVMLRSDGLNGGGVEQYSTLLGGVAPKPNMRRNYKNIASTHLKKSAKPFIQAMVLLAKECGKIMQIVAPELYKNQLRIMQKVDGDYKFTDLFTSSISNYNISANFHTDRANIKGALNCIVTKRLNAVGGNLFVPDYGACMDSANNSLLVYPAWKNMHGVTPIKVTENGGYRNSLVFYSLNCFVKKD